MAPISASDVLGQCAKIGGITFSATLIILKVQMDDEKQIMRSMLNNPTFSHE